MRVVEDRGHTLEPKGAAVPRRDEVVAALGSRGIESTIEGLSIVVKRQTEEQLDDIRDAIVEAEARLRRLAPSRGQLTDIFRRADN